MSVTISNAKLSATVAETGAELKSLVEHSTGNEYIWQSDPAHWTGAAPILFPIIGTLKNNEYSYRGKTYSMGGHGIVRKAEWKLVASDATSATFEIVSSDETKKQYPFDFALRASFTLQDASIAIGYEVKNTGKDEMFFSIGSHPAVNVPFAGGYPEHYYFHFSQPENMERYFYKGGVHLNETEPIFNNSRQIFVTPTLFDQGPIIFKNPASQSVTIMNSRNTKRVRVRTEGVPFLALWAPAGAPFACIEPWHGVMDNVDTDGEFTTKEGIMSLAAGGTYKTGYWIDILDGGGV
ncbi:MAG: aldose 1-epimerase family protein [Phycisphaerae bacterium]|jgi:galactose mutarotase-like enzyme|nr:aldose 1-epimerase family protein [Phycisphaerae bacterium]